MQSNECERGGLTVHVCNDCGAWCRPGERIRHSKRCDTPTAQPAQPAQPAEAEAPSAPQKAPSQKRTAPARAVLAPEHVALLDALTPLATPKEAEGLRLARLGAVRAEDLVRVLEQAVGCFVRADPSRDGRTLRPAGAPAPTQEQRDEIRRLAVAAGVRLS